MVNEIKEAVVEIYCSGREYFAKGLEGYKFHRIDGEDKIFFGDQIGEKLRNKGIVKCIFRAVKERGKALIREDDLDTIARNLNFSLGENEDGRIEFEVDPNYLPEKNHYIKRIGDKE